MCSFIGGVEALGGFEVMGGTGRTDFIGTVGAWPRNVSIIDTNVMLSPHWQESLVLSQY